MAEPVQLELPLDTWWIDDVGEGDEPDEGESERDGE
jgi:hypothetical protein